MDETFQRMIDFLSSTPSWSAAPADHQLENVFFFGMVRIRILDANDTGIPITKLILTLIM